MAAIDMHTHAFPDQLAERAIRTLEAECPWKAVGDGTLDGLIASMDAADVDVAVVCMIATKPDHAKSILAWCEKVRSDRIEPFPSVHPDTPKPGKAVDKIAKAGFAGMKLHPMYQEFAADEPRLDPIYAAAAGAGLVVAVHCGRDIAYPPDDDRAAPERFARVLDRHPSLRLLCTHMGGWRMWDESDDLLVGRAIHLETSFSTGERGTDTERIVNMIRRHGVDRVCFGSDWPWAPQKEDLDRLAGSGLTKAELRKILWSNAAGLLGY